MSSNVPSVTSVHEEPIPLITSRLNLIIGTEKRHVSSTGGKAPNGERKDTSKTIMFKLNEFPLDIVLEIVSYLDPEDLLKLCRLSTGSRALFLSKNCTAVWRDVLAGQVDLPKCPRDLTGPQYASLIFDKFCMGCGSTRGNIETQYLLRLRLCQGCSNKNVVTGYSLKSRFGQSFCDVLLTLLPSTGPGLICFYPKLSVLSSHENKLNMSYFLPEAEKMVAELEARKEQQGSPEYQKFISDQQVVATRMMNEGLAINVGADYTMQKREDTEAAVRRRKTMLAEMKALGWEKKYFPTDPKHPFTEKWNGFLDRKHDLSDREWELIRPLMQVIYEFQRNQVRMEALLKQLEKAYPSLRKKQSALVRVGLAPWLDILTLPSVINFVTIHHRRKCNDNDMNQFLQLVQANAFDFLTGAAESLIEIVDKGLEKEGSTVETVKLASTLFICSCDKCEADKVDNGELFAYPNIDLHWSDANCESSWFVCSRFDVSLDPQAVKVAEDVLAALGLPKDTQRDTILKMGGFVCRCDHPHFSGPLSFEALVYHVHHEQVMCAKMKRLLYPKSDPETQALIHEIHSPERLRELLAIAGPTDQGSTKRKRKLQLNYEKICRLCYQLTLMCHINEGGLHAYHMKTMHGRKLVKGDMLSIEELDALYGARPEGTLPEDY
ncbi:hypothetical protein M413DRAFT_258597 [Hebeloma cylindrosporum]|uniref:F-box domain-containing protein n=1 Tax=Hebeloma cylindrosporum TaxID=76867 RepID=A0A0C2XIK5_HEBCY|nr:hypothetical protein M413DRAFT_258597 [Hebeloma cylindrosporum h7]